MSQLPEAATQLRRMGAWCSDERAIDQEGTHVVHTGRAEHGRDNDCVSTNSSVMVMRRGSLRATCRSSRVASRQRKKYAAPLSTELSSDSSPSMPVALLSSKRAPTAKPMLLTPTLQPKRSF